MAKTKQSFCSEDSFKLIRAAFSAFPTLWWRIGVVNLVVMLMIVLGAAIVLGSLFLLLGGGVGIESIVANYQVLGEASLMSLFLSNMGIFIGGMVFSLLWILIFGSLGKIANLLTVKNYVKKTTKNPFQIYFLQSWAYLWKYLILTLRIFWYVSWPALLILIVVLILTIFLNPLLAMGAPFLLVPLLIWRVANVFFAMPFLIQFNKGISNSFKGALSVVKGNFWFVFLNLLALGLCMMAFNVGFASLAQVLEGNLELLVNGLDFLVSFFILPPIVLSFVYFLMVHMAKAKKIK